MTLLARGISRNSKMNGTSILGPGRGVRRRRWKASKGGVHHCETIQREKEGKKGKNETEGIGSVESRRGEEEGSEVKTQRRCSTVKGDRRRMVGGETRVSRVCSNTQRPCSTFTASSSPLPPRLFALFAWSARGSRRVRHSTFIA